MFTVVRANNYSRIPIEEVRTFENVKDARKYLKDYFKDYVVMAKRETAHSLYNPIRDYEWDLNFAFIEWENENMVTWSVKKVVQSD